MVPKSGECSVMHRVVLLFSSQSLLLHGSRLTGSNRINGTFATGPWWCCKVRWMPLFLIMTEHVRGWKGPL